MHDHVAEAGTDYRKVIYALRQIGEQIGDINAALTVLAKRPPRAEELRFGADELVARFAEFLRARLAAQFVQERFGIECFEMARPASHEQEDHRLGFGQVMRRLCRERIERAGASLLVMKN